MSNGGYKGSTPARETSPEQYPGVWELTEQFQAQADGNWPFQETDCAPKSLRFDGSSAYLDKTFGTRTTTFTLSFWVKRSKLGTWQYPWSQYDGSGYSGIGFSDDNRISLYNGGHSYTTAYFRDTSAWYHLCLKVSLGSGTLYVNNQEVATQTGLFLGGGLSKIGNFYSGSHPFDGYIAEFNTVADQALDPDAFTFIDGQGILQPKRFTGDYSSGPFYSNNSSTLSDPVNAFDGSTSTFSYVNSSGALGEFTGLSIPAPANSTMRVRVDSGSAGNIKLNGSNVASFNGGAAQWVTVASANIPSLITSIGIQSSSGPGIAVVELNGVALIDATVGHNSFHLDFSDGVKDQSGVGNDWTSNNIEFPGPLVQDWESMLTGAHDTNHGWGTTYGSDNMFDGALNTYTIGQANATGLTFTPTSPLGASATTIRIYGMDDNCPDSHLKINGVNYGGLVNSGTTWTVLKGTGAVGSGITSITSIYLRDNSAGNEHYRFAALEIDGVIITQGGDPDLLLDSPVNGNEASTGAGSERRGNYATLNPLNKASGTTLSNGNLDLSSSSNWGSCMSTVAFTGGKYYYETTVTSSNYSYIGASLATHLGNRYPSQGVSWALLNDGNCYYDQLGSGALTVNTGTSVPAGAVVGTAIDADNGKIWWSVNGTWIGSGSPNPATGAGAIFTNIPTDQALVACLDVYTNSASVNFGQRGFSYVAPSGFSPIATSFLPEPSIPVPAQYFDTKLYTSNAADLAVTGLQFSPSFVWVKNRELGNPHGLFDIVRGPNKYISSGRTNAEINVTGSGYPGGTLNSFDSNGFTLGADSGNNVSNYPANDAHVAWAWSAGDATTTIAAGGLNSSLYNQDQRWRDNISSSNGWNTSYPVNNIFNGVFDGGGGAANNGNGGSITFTPPASIAVTKLELTCYSEVTLELPDGSTQTIAGVGNTNQTVTANIGSGFTFTGSNSIIISRTAGFIYLEKIKINGKELVDDNISLANVPSIASTVRSSPESGFSIVTWTAAANATVAHQLNKSPELVLTKSRQHATAWRIWSPFFSSPDDRYLGFDANGEGTYNGYWGSMTSNVITMPSVLDNNYGDMVAYCFTSIEGYSSFGSYQNPSSTEGAFVFLGFEPELLMIKCIINISSSSSSGDWIIKDATRSPFNNPSDGNTLVANVNNEEDNYYSGSQAAIDILSNGFKIRHPNSSPAGDTGRLYIYAAWAKSPFKNARAR